MKTTKDTIKQQINIKNINDKSLILIETFLPLALMSKISLKLGSINATANGIII